MYWLRPALKNKIDALRNNCADYVILDNGRIASEVKQLFSSDDENGNGADGVNCVLELIGTVTLLDSMQAAAPKGIVCNTLGSMTYPSRFISIFSRIPPNPLITGVLIP